MSKDKLIAVLKKLTGHEFAELTLRGDAAIAAALSIIPKDKVVLIPEEGGWLSYPRIPAKLGLKVVEVKCDQAKINVADLEKKLQQFSVGALLYQNPGGYFAEQPMKEIFALCSSRQSLVIMDVSGSIGTDLCDGSYADILVGSFGEWKLVEAKAGGFLSCQHKIKFGKIKKNIQALEDEKTIAVISKQIQGLASRISFLTEKRQKIIRDLRQFSIVHPRDLGFVVVVKYNHAKEKENLINYCVDNNLSWTECPRYIRLNQPAISIEVKRLP
jgi:hypothetical protein